MQCRQPSLEGTGEIPLRRLVKEALRMRPSRIIVGEVRQEECLDLLIALNCGLPGHVHHPRQLRPRGRHQDVHAAAAGRRERRPRVRRADRRRLHRPRRAHRDRARRPPRGCARSSPCPAGSRATSSRPPTSSSPAAAGWCGPTASRRTPSGSSAPASTWPALLAPYDGVRRPDGRARRAAARARAVPASGGRFDAARAAPSRDRVDAAATGSADLLAQAGIEAVTPGALVAVVRRRRRRRARR